MKLYQKLGLVVSLVGLSYTAQGQTGHKTAMPIANQTSPAIASGQFTPKNQYKDTNLDFIKAAKIPGDTKAQIRIYGGDGDGEFRYYSIIGTVPCANQSSPALTTGDFNNDGNLDFLISATLPGTNLTKTYKYLGNGKGGFTRKN